VSSASCYILENTSFGDRVVLYVRIVLLGNYQKGKCVSSVPRRMRTRHNALRSHRGTEVFTNYAGDTCKF
jgi:hypothetical protein